MRLRGTRGEGMAAGREEVPLPASPVRLRFGSRLWIGNGILRRGSAGREPNARASNSPAFRPPQHLLVLLLHQVFHDLIKVFHLDDVGIAGLLGRRGWCRRDTGA